MRPGRAPTLQLRAPASVSFGSGKRSLGQGSREGAEALSPPIPLLGLQEVGVSLVGGWKETKLLVQLPAFGWAEGWEMVQHGSAWQCGTAWHGMAVWHSVARPGTAQWAPGMPWAHQDKAWNPCVSMGAAEPEQTQPGWMRPAPAPRSDREAPASGMNSQSKTRQPESTTP